MEENLLSRTYNNAEMAELLSEVRHAQDEYKTLRRFQGSGPNIRDYVQSEYDPWINRIELENKLKKISNKISMVIRVMLPLFAVIAYIVLGLISKILFGVEDYSNLSFAYRLSLVGLIILLVIVIWYWVKKNKSIFWYVGTVFFPLPTLGMEENKSYLIAYVITLILIVLPFVLFKRISKCIYEILKRKKKYVKQFEEAEQKDKEEAIIDRKKDEERYENALEYFREQQSEYLPRKKEIEDAWNRYKVVYEYYEDFAKDMVKSYPDLFDSDSYERIIYDIPIYALGNIGLDGGTLASYKAAALIGIDKRNDEYNANIQEIAETLADISNMIHSGKYLK